MALAVAAAVTVTVADDIVIPPSLAVRRAKTPVEAEVEVGAQSIAIMNVTAAVVHTPHHPLILPQLHTVAAAAVAVTEVSVAAIITVAVAVVIPRKAESIGARVSAVAEAEAGIDIADIDIDIAAAVTLHHTAEAEAEAVAVTIVIEMSMTEENMGADGKARSGGE